MIPARGASLLAIAATMSIASAGTVTMPSLQPHDLYFFSSAPKAITFYLSTDNRTWTELDVPPGGSRTVSLDGNPSTIVVAIKTGDRLCKVAVEIQHRYEIYWTAADQEYCVRPLVPR
jgi:hypothetical protein